MSDFHSLSFHNTRIDHDTVSTMNHFFRLISILVCLMGCSGGEKVTTQTTPLSLEELLRRSQEVHRKVDRGEYRLRFRREIEGFDPISFRGYTIFEKDPQEKVLGGRISISIEGEGEGRNSLHWDGTVAIFIDSLQGLAWTIPEEQVQSFVYGSPYRGGAIRTSLFEGVYFDQWIQKADTLLRVEGMTINGKDCIGIEFRFPDNQVFTNIVTTCYIDTTTYLVLGQRKELSTGGREDVEEYYLEEVNLSVGDLDERIFSPQLPEGYTISQIAVAAQVPVLAVGGSAPAWSGETEGGETFSSEELRGSIVLLDFWFTLCGPCLKLMPALQRLHTEYAQEKVRVIGVHCREPLSVKPQEFLNRRGSTYPTIVRGDSLAAMFKVTSYPTTYVIAPDGNIVHVKEGYSSNVEDQLHSIIDSLLSEMKEGEK